MYAGNDRSYKQSYCDLFRELCREPVMCAITADFAVPLECPFILEHRLKDAKVRQ